MRASRSSLFAARPRRAKWIGRNRRKKSCLKGIESLEDRRVLATVPVISEFMAVNNSIIEDSDGDDSDWLELHNAGDDDMSLNRWYLTDDAGDLRKWRLPDVELGAGDYLLVYASGKDRDVAGEELHTNFRLTGTGEYLALVQPDGITVAHEFKTYPQQVGDVSYGIPTGVESSELISTAAAAKYFVPTDASLDPTEPDVVAGTWLDPDLDDSAWGDATTGIGYVPSTDPEVLANSEVDFSGVQGQDNWFYGSWLGSFDPDGVYSSSDFGEIGSNFFDAAANEWDMGRGAAGAKLTAIGGNPSTNALFSQSVVRRWVSETNGELLIEGTFANADAAGDGVRGQIFVNDQEVFQRVLNGESTNYSITLDAQVGDLIDFLMTPGDADDSVGDAATFTAQITGTPLKVHTLIGVADSSDDWSRDGIQGEAGWFYGYYDPKADADSAYQADDFRQFGPSIWSGRRWEWPDPVETQISSSNMYPYADDNVVHWPIRRWESTIDGTVAVDWRVAKSTASGDGATARVFHNGVQVDSIQVPPTSDEIERSVKIEGVRVGDTIDLAMDPVGTGNPQQPDSESDRLRGWMTISRIPDLSESISTDIREEIEGDASSLYVRIPFQVEDVSALDEITLKVRYNDGFVAYVNGHQVAAANSPDAPAFDSKALEARAVEDATLAEPFDLTSARRFFNQGENLLQIHALNVDAADVDLLIDPQLSIGTATINAEQSRYFRLPTPGGENGLGAERLGPLVVDVQHTPALPAPADPLVITAAVSPTFENVAAVSLTYRVMYDDSTSMTMVDDGSGDDQAAGDGIFTATIPGNIATPGQMIRWFVTAQDATGLEGRFPVFADASNHEEYKGTIIDDPTIETNLPLLHWFIERRSRAATAGGERGSLFFNGEFYDNVEFSLHGQSSSGFSTQKKSMNVDMPNDNRFLLNSDLRRMEDFNLLTNFADKSKMRNSLGYAQRAATGGASHLAFPIRVQHNGEFFGIYDFVEDGDQRWLARLGLDENGSLYKIYNTFNSVASAEKKTREDEGNDDLRDVIAGVGQRGEEDTAFIFDNINLAQMANFLAGFVLTSNVDCCHKNFYAYHDIEGTGEWWFLPWDVDLSNGRNWGGFGLAYFDDTIYHERGLSIGGNNVLIGKLYNDREVPGFREMYWRRVRTLIDEYVKPPGTPAAELPLETHVAELYDMLKPDADRDNEMHRASWGQTGFQTFDEAVQILLTEYATPRRTWLYETQVMVDDSDVNVILSGEPGETMASYFVPKDGALGLTWTQPDFDDSSWKVGPTGLGFEDDPDDFVELVRTDVKADMEGSSSVYTRIRFNVDDPAALSGLSLRMKYDDGYVAYLNGVEVARQRLRQDDPTFDSTARTHSNRMAVEYENANISDFIGELKSGENVLAIHGINSSATGNDFLLLPELVEGVLGAGNGPIPAAQKGNPKIDFGTIEFNPTSGNQREEYIQLVNNHEVAVDISGWRLEGAVEHTFDPGTVIPTGWTLYAAADAKAFRARTEGPTGGMQLFVQGNYAGQLPNGGGEFRLVARDGEIVNSAVYEGEVSTLRDHLRVTEVMYHPIGASAAELAADNTLVADDFEYIELVNISDTETISLQNVQFTEGVTFDFTNSQVTELTPGQRTLVVRNTSAFQTRYGTDLTGMIAGEFALNTALRDSNETLKLIDGSGLSVADFEYSDRDDQGWPARADGNGSSLQVVDPSGDYTDPANWRASSEINGSPGAAGDAPVSGLVINELASRTVDPEVDRVELFNPTAAEISTAGYFLSDNSASVDTLRYFALGAGTVAGGAYLVVDESNFNPGGGQNATDFALNGDRGDELFLTVGDDTGPTHFVDAVSFGAAAPGESFGRVPNGSGRLAPMQTQTFGELNSDPRVGPIVVTEVNYNPGVPSAEAIAIYDVLTSDDLEFIEIHNSSANAMDLTEMRIRGGVDLNFDAGSQLGAGQTAVVISFNPANNAARTTAFRTHYGIDEGVVLIGGYAGQLSDQGEGLRLLRPGDPPADDPGFIPRLLEDEVIYDDVAPWPAEANGSSKSLTRVSPSSYGNNAASWVAADPTPGSIGDVAGDVNGDGVVDVHDVDAVCGARMAGDVGFDLNGDGAIDQADTLVLVNDILGTSVGDVDLDGAFNSHDLVLIFRQGQYADGQAGNSTWATGDWNCDGEFNEDDLIFSLQAGSYESQAAPQGNAAVAAAVLDRGVSQGPRQKIAETANLPDTTVPTHRALLDPVSHDAVFADAAFDQRAADEGDAADDLAISLQEERLLADAFDL